MHKWSECFEEFHEYKFIIIVYTKSFLAHLVLSIHQNLARPFCYARITWLRQIIVNTTVLWVREVTSYEWYGL